MLFSLVVYIATHELIHIVRFSKFLQNFHASPDEKQAEEKRVHEKHMKSSVTSNYVECRKYSNFQRVGEFLSIA